MSEVSGNRIGEGLIMGGTAIIRAGEPGENLYAYSERIFGDFAPWREVHAVLEQNASA